MPNEQIVAGHSRLENQPSPASGSLMARHEISEHHACHAGYVDDGDQPPAENHGNLVTLIDEITELWKERVDHHKAEKSLTLQIKARCRRLCDGDKDEAKVLYEAMLGKGKADHNLAEVAFSANVHFLQAREIMESTRKQLEKRLKALAKKLPIYEWAQNKRGLGDVLLCGVVGYAGDLSNYATVSRLWKRMGLAVIGGERQRKKKGPEALRHGYDPKKRSVVWNIGDSVIKSRGAWVHVYQARKAYERERAEAAGLIVAPANKIPKKRAAEYMSDGHIHNRAKRYMEKRVVKDMWVAWRRATGQSRSNEGVPAAVQTTDADHNPSDTQSETVSIDSVAVGRIVCDTPASHARRDAPVAAE